MILAIDPGRTTGWASSRHATGSFVTPTDDFGRALHLWEQWLADLVATERPTTMAIERAFFSGRARDADWPMTLIRTAHKIAYLHDVRRVELAAISVRKRIFGKGRGTTDAERIAIMRERGWVIRSDHEADAAALHDAARGIEALT